MNFVIQPVLYKWNQACNDNNNIFISYMLQLFVNSTLHNMKEQLLCHDIAYIQLNFF